VTFPFRRTRTTVSLDPEIIFILETVPNVLNLLIRDILRKPPSEPRAFLFDDHKPVDKISVLVVNEQGKASRLFRDVAPFKRWRLSFSRILDAFDPT
jgi:hypothetical protein